MSRHIKSLLLASVVGAAWAASAASARAQDAPADLAAAAPAPDAADNPAPRAPSGAGPDDAAHPPARTGYPDVQVMAVQPVDPGAWRITAAPYLWMAGIKGAVSVSPAVGSASTINADVDMDFPELLKRLHVVFMGAAEARRGKFSVQTDLIYLSLSQGGARIRDVTGPGGRGFPVSLGSNLKLKTTLWTVSAGYDVFRDDRAFVQLFAGFRYLGADTSLDWNFEGPLADVPRTGHASKRGEVWDAIAGARGEVALGDGRWKLISYADAGTGGSKLTWQAAGQLAYAWRWGDVGVGWRYLDYRMDGGKALQNLRMSGPIVVAHYRF